MQNGTSVRVQYIAYTALEHSQTHDYSLRSVAFPLSVIYAVVALVPMPERALKYCSIALTATAYYPILWIM